MANLILLITVVILSACSEFQANTHPDDYFEGDRGIASAEQLYDYMEASNNNPQFREAKVTTQFSSLKIKSEPTTYSQPPSGVSPYLAKGAKVTVYWPLNIVNNHVRIFINNKPAWVTYRSNSGQQYVTLIEEIAMPQLSTPGAQYINTGTSNTSGWTMNFTNNSRPPVQAPPPSPPEISQITSSIIVNTIQLSQAAINEAYLAIREVALTPADIFACQFDPLVGNQASPNNCYQKIVLSSAFRDFIKVHGHQCASQATLVAFGQSAKKILFHSSSAGQVRRNRTVSGSSKKSSHAIGQAIDLFAVSVFFQNNQSRRINMHRDHVDGASSDERQNNQFYWAYVNCWRARIKSHAPCNCSSSLSGAITYTNDAAHYNHVHMSLPFCERSKYHVSCV